jgi:hypothetical protein
VQISTGLEYKEIMTTNKNNKALLSNIRRGVATGEDFKEAIRILNTVPQEDWDDFHVILAAALSRTLQPSRFLDA